MNAKAKRELRLARLVCDWGEAVTLHGYPPTRAGLDAFWAPSRSRLEALAAQAGVTLDQLAETVLAAFQAPTAEGLQP